MRQSHVRLLKENRMNVRNQAMSDLHGFEKR